VSCGFAGGLDDAAAPGDLVLATTVSDDSGDAIAAPAQLRAAAANALAGMRFHQGELICTSSVAATQTSKRALARPGAIAVDMESHPVARAAQEAGIPWLALRAIVDPLDSALPPFARTAQSGYVWPALRHALSGPGATLELVRLGLRAKKAGAALEEALRRVAPVFGPAEVRR
jgi:uridine phosphorylase